MNENVITQKKLQCEKNKRNKKKKSKGRKECIGEELLTTNQQFVISVVGNIFLVVLENVVNRKTAILALNRRVKWKFFRLTPHQISK